MRDKFDSNNPEFVDMVYRAIDYARKQDYGMGKDAKGMKDGGEVEEAGESPAVEAAEDTVPAMLSVGEFVNSADVVKAVGVDFFEKLQEMFHTPTVVKAGEGKGYGVTKPGMAPKRGI